MNKKQNKNNITSYSLNKETIVKVIAWHKKTDAEMVKIMTFEEWLKIKKSKLYFYKCVQYF